MSVQEKKKKKLRLAVAFQSYDEQVSLSHLLNVAYLFAMDLWFIQVMQTSTAKSKQSPWTYIHLYVYKVFKSS